MTLSLHYACCKGFWSIVREDNQMDACPICKRPQWPAEMYQVEKTEAGWQRVMPSYTPPSTQERVQHLVSLPYSSRKGRAEKARPPTIGLFDEEARLQLNLF